MAEESIRRRAACDRCHSQKIRCPRKPGQDVCDRCQKARTPCVFSPFRQKKVLEGDPEADESSAVSLASNAQREATGSNIGSSLRKRQRIQSSIERQELSIFDQDFMLAGSVQVDTSPEDVMNDWMSNPLPSFQNFPDSTFDDLNLVGQTPFLLMDATGQCSNTFNEPTPKRVDCMIQARKEANMSRTIKNTSSLAENLPAQPSSLDLYGYSIHDHLSFESLDSHSESDCIRNLSQLSTDLFEHSNTIPPMTIYDPPPADMGDDGVYQGTQGCQDYSNYHVDETLRLTQNLIDMYPAFLNAFLPHLTSESSIASSTWSSDRMSNTNFETAQHPSASSTTSSYKRAIQSLDHSAILLILSCHLRLISIYEALFQHMKICFDERGVVKPPQQVTLSVPQLKIGDFAPPPSAAIPMQMLLLVQFASRLFNYAADLASEVREPEQGTPESDSSNGSSSDDTLALTRAAAENVKARASNMSQELGAMRILMLQTGHLA